VSKSQIRSSRPTYLNDDFQDERLCLQLPPHRAQRAFYPRRTCDAVPPFLSAPAVKRARACTLSFRPHHKISFCLSTPTHVFAYTSMHTRKFTSATERDGDKKLAMCFMRAGLRTILSWSHARRVSSSDGISHASMCIRRNES
jgi:hypothetical protein